MKHWTRYMRTYPVWVYRPWDTAVAWFYRLAYCSRHGHHTKLQSNGRCVYCAKRV
jgi:hypothetical protein